MLLFSLTFRQSAMLHAWIHSHKSVCEVDYTAAVFFNRFNSILDVFLSMWMHSGRCWQCLQIRTGANIRYTLPIPKKSNTELGQTAMPTSVRWGLGLKPHWLHTMERHCVQVLKLDLSSPLGIRSVVLQTGHSLLLGMGAIWGTEYGEVGTLPRSGDTEGDLPVLLLPTSTCRLFLATWPWPCSPWGAECWGVSWEASLSPVPWLLWTPVLGPRSDGL